MSEQEAVRHPKRGKAHRYAGESSRVWGFRAACGTDVRTVKPIHMPLRLVPPADRCKVCWKKEAE